MRDSTFSKQLALILGYFGISANFGGSVVSLITGFTKISKAENFIISAGVCFFCTFILIGIFYYLCFKKKRYAKFNAVAITFSGFVSFTAMYIATGNFICGFPYYMMIIPIYYGFSVPINKLSHALPVSNLIYYNLLFVLTFKAPYFPGRAIMPNLSLLQTSAAFTATYIFLFYVCYLVSKQFIRQNAELEESEKRYKELSSRDDLTGLYNRRSLDNRAEQGFSCAIIYDIDFFKNINDTYGHQIGDEALIMLSNIVLKYCSNEFELYRYGGEEFVILSRLPDNVTLELFKHVMNDVRMHFIVKGNPVTISAGIASFCKDYNRTLKIADENLYLAKTDGRNKIYMNGEEVY
ncbi:GGDEF domain-containing protein [Treponema bryantii]|uniref:GGDEF domain-containing protein n=1 Tax=Treponema bryantii TaxID=163 RepID=UPI002B29ED84|nr:hypothetical protein TRBR_05600 [Treponema bryantii]